MSGEDHKAFGVSKPVGHVLMSFRSAPDQQAAAAALMQAGFAEADLVRYTPEQMLREAEGDIAAASPLAGIGQELNLVKAHRDRARQGESFLLVDARSDEKVEQVAEVARRCRATRAQRFGTLLIEELVDVGSDQAQVAESTDRGLDAQTVSGREGGKAQSAPKTSR